VRRERDHASERLTAAGSPTRSARYATALGPIEADQVDHEEAQRRRLRAQQLASSRNGGRGRAPGIPDVKARGS
jgi:hypothetical protein